MNHSSRAYPSSRSRLATALALARAAVPALPLLLLGACGGGDSADALVAGAAAQATLTLTGTAATGAAVAGRTVEARCRSGSGSATSAADGRYNIAITDGALPCVLRVTLADGSTLHSLALGGSDSATANLTPVSQLVLARLAAADPASFFSGFDAAAAGALDKDKVQTAVAIVLQVLKDAEVDIGDLNDPMTAPLVAAAGGAVGNAFDQALDSFNMRLANAGTTLPALVTAMMRSAPEAPTTLITNAPSLAPEMLLRPAAANCSALRSGRYRFIINDDGGAGRFATEVVSVDAPALKVTNATGEVSTLTAAGACRYTTPQGGSVTVSAAGVGVAQVDAAPFRAAVFFPEQSHAPAALAGEWNTLALDRTDSSSAIHLTAWTATIDSSGKLSGGLHCDAVVGPCETLAGVNLPDLTLTANEAGGLNFVNASDNFSDRLFVYRAGGGELMFVLLSPSGHITFGTRKAARGLPAEGDRSEGWQLTLQPNARAPFYTAPFAMSQYRSITTRVDAATGGYERSAVTNFTSGVTRTEDLRVNSPRAGYLQRQPGTVTASNGASSVISEWVGLPLRGMGMTAVGILSSNQLVLSVGQAQ